VDEIQKVEAQIGELVQKLEKLRKDSAPVAVKNYTFESLEGDVDLIDLFAGKEKLIAIHNMGQGCRYCTLWADGINAFLPHLEDQYSVVMMSKDDPETQRRFANSRGWRFRMVSHSKTNYSKEQSVLAGKNNMPGIVCYMRQGDQVFKKNSSAFGPGDLFCSLWHILSVTGAGEGDWTPQYNYWQRPAKLDDGGADVR
jgi:predicted dithiol-disulfide oxidoreductase (DUF899 family)